MLPKVLNARKKAESSFSPSVPKLQRPVALPRLPYHSQRRSAVVGGTWALAELDVFAVEVEVVEGPAMIDEPWGDCPRLSCV